MLIAKKVIKFLLPSLLRRSTIKLFAQCAKDFFKLYHGDPMSISTANHIYGELKKHGYSVRRWALERGFSPRTVQECIHTYAPCKQRKPASGTVSSRIVAALSETLGVALYGEDK